MLTRLLESALVGLVNAAHGRRRPAPSSPPAAEDVVLGHLLTQGDTFPPVPPSSAPTLVALSPAARRRHLYVLGATGTGKTNLLLHLLESDIAARRAFCVVDLRGDLVDRILLRLAAQAEKDKQSPQEAAERLLLLDLRQPERVVGFNPLLRSSDAYSRAFHVLSVLRQQSDSWGIQLEETLRNALLALAETGYSLLEIEPLLGDAAFRASVLSQVTDDYVRSFFARYGALSEDKQATWRLPVLNKVTPLLAIPQLRQMFGQRRSFDFGALLDTVPGQIILISLAVDRLHGAAHLVGGLLMSAFQTAIMARVDQPEAARVPVHLYVDEFETMATEQFEAILAEGRRFGLGLCLSHQNLTQLPASLRSVLLTNAHTQLYFQTGAADASELAREIVTDRPAQAVRQALLAQKTGQAFLVRRGETAVQLQARRCLDPKVEPSWVAALREAALNKHGRPREEVSAELTARHGGLTSALTPSTSLPATRKRAQPQVVAPSPPLLPQPPGDDATNQSPPGSDRAPSPKTLEVRHGKKHGFKPEEKKPDPETLNPESAAK